MCVHVCVRVCVCVQAGVVRCARACVKKAGRWGAGSAAGVRGGHSLPKQGWCTPSAVLVQVLVLLLTAAGKAAQASPDSLILLLLLLLKEPVQQPSAVGACCR